MGEACGARQSATPQVAAIEPDETLYGLFDLLTGSVETASECDSSGPATEVLMVDGPHSPLASAAATAVMVAVIRRAFTRSTISNPSLHSRGRNFVAGTWMHCILL